MERNGELLADRIDNLMSQVHTLIVHKLERYTETVGFLIIQKRSDMAYPQSGRGALPVNAGVGIFGADAAEEDSNLNLYFLETDTWQRVVNGQLLLVLGSSPFKVT